MKSMTKIAAAISLGWLCNSAAFAAADAALSVEGTITPAACNVDLGLTNNQVDFGVIPSHTFKDSRDHSLPVQRFSVDVACLSQIKVALKLSDNRSDSAVPVGSMPGGAYGLGVSPSNAKIGRYAMNFESAEGDGRLIAPLVETSPGVWEYGAPFFSHGQNIAWTDMSDTTPQAFTNLKFGLALVASIVSDQGMVFDQDILLDGSSIFEVVYL